jgi:hypothetical protein
MAQSPQKEPRARAECVCLSLPHSNVFNAAMHRTPNAPHALVGADHALSADEFVLLAGVRDEELEFLQDLLFFQVAHAHGLFAPVDVVRLEHRVFVGARGDAELRAREPRREVRQHGRREERFHPPAGPGPVAVVEVETFTLENEGGETVLFQTS